MMPSTVRWAGRGPVAKLLLRSTGKLVLLLLSFLASFPAVLRAADWPHWRGPERNGVVPERSGWDGEQWLDREPLWSTSVGIGSTSPLVVDGRLYTMGWSNNRDHVVCLDANTGERIWNESYACPKYGRVAEATLPRLVDRKRAVVLGPLRRCGILHRDD